MDIVGSLIEFPKWEDVHSPEEVSEENVHEEVGDGPEDGPLSSFSGDRGDQPSENNVISSLGHGVLKYNLELALLGGGCVQANSSFLAKVVVKQGKKFIEDTVLRVGVLPVTLVISGLLLTSISKNILQTL